MKKKLLAGLAIGLFMVSMVGTASANLIINGDFELGNVGFFSDYSNSTHLNASTIYVITTNPEPLHKYAASYGDHTTGLVPYQ